MKPEDVLKERWESTDAVVRRRLSDADAAEYGSSTETVGDYNFAHGGTPRARIAACAPEALSLLVEAEWVPRYPDNSGCAFCSGYEPIEGNHCAAEYSGGPLGHEGDCRWLALMKRAGLR